MLKKRLLAVILLCSTFAAHADEGIWLPALISERISDMQSKGFTLTAEDVYSINNASMKDGVVLFGGGCTGEVISKEGLILTNHHCGLGQIQSHSSVEKDYLTNGFTAASRSEELPNQGLNVKFLVRMEDVTQRIAAGETAKEIADKAKKGNHYKTSVEPLYYANQWFLFVYEQFDDVRLVAAPPSSIGKFGGDTDNWIWPRHTGDFALFRIYADSKNRPAAYSPKNRPYKSKFSFPISTKGVQEGDFTMIYGFPGNTQQYITSDAVDYLINYANPMKIALRTKRLDIITEAQEADPAVRIRYASKHATIANSWKKWQGEELGLRRLKTLEAKQKYEGEFTEWATKNAEYQSLMDSMRVAYAENVPQYAEWELLRESVGAIELLTLYRSMRYPLNKERIELFYKDYEMAIDKAIALEMLTELEGRSAATKLGESYAQLIEPHGSTSAYVDFLFENSAFATQEKLAAATASEAKYKELMANDPIAELATRFSSMYRYLGRNLSDMPEIAKWYKPYLAALREFDENRAFFPDANLTLRVAYGRVGGYQYEDGVYHKHLTTLKGILEKDNPEIYDYNIPEELRKRLTNSDLGRWSVEINGEQTIPVCFLANNQTTGGNSGSPIINANGELVGLNFDRTWLSTMSDVAFDPDFCRNISVDIRYVLFVLEEILDGYHIVDEMELR